jgi:hypothetical protein
MEDSMVTSLKKTMMAGALVTAGLLASSAANAQLTFQGVTFTPSWSGNTLTLEVDADNPTGDWSTADAIGSLQLKDFGTWDSVVLSGPGSFSSWTISGNELGANGCDGGSDGVQRLCLNGTPITLTDDMMFTFTFTGGVQTTDSVFIKVRMFDEGSTEKVGSLMSLEVPVIPEPSTYAMLLGGLGVIALARRNAKKRKSA